jgi:hypothetical protein
MHYLKMMYRQVLTKEWFEEAINIESTTRLCSNGIIMPHGTCQALSNTCIAKSIITIITSYKFSAQQAVDQIQWNL